MDKGLVQQNLKFLISKDISFNSVWQFSLAYHQ
jgi:hypothetical protein